MFYGYKEQPIIRQCLLYFFPSCLIPAAHVTPLNIEIISLIVHGSNLHIKDRPSVSIIQGPLGLEASDNIVQLVYASCILQQSAPSSCTMDQL